MDRSNSYREFYNQNYGLFPLVLYKHDVILINLCESLYAYHIEFMSAIGGESFSSLVISHEILETSNLDVWELTFDPSHWTIEDTFNRHNIPDYVREYFLNEYFPNRVSSSFMYEHTVIGRWLNRI